MAFHIHMHIHILSLLFLLAICCQAQLSCYVVIKNMRRLVMATGEYYDYCGCNGTVQLKDIPSLQSETNYEFVKLRVKYTHPPDRPYFCDWRRIEPGFAIFVRPILVIRDFECEIQQQITCFFSRPGDIYFKWQNKYTMQMDDGQSVPCAEIPGREPFRTQFMQCTIVIKPKTWKNIEHVFVVTMTDSVFEQREEIKMLTEKMTSRPWPFIHAMFKLSIDGICLYWFRAPQDIGVSQISVRLIPLNPKLPEVVYGFEEFPDTNNWCFSVKLHPYQTYNIRLLANLGYELVYFSENYDAGNATSLAEIPSCPPQVLTDGFFYDPAQRQLHIFWMPLDELDVNGPNLQFSVQTDTGIHKPPVLTRLLSPTGTQSSQSLLEIPRMTNAKERQAQSVWYHVGNFTITWRPPKQQSQLIGYTVFWCSASRNLKLICDNTEPFHVINLDQSQHQLQLNQSMMGSSMAVACHYKDKPSGGLTWIDTTVIPFTNDKDFGPVLALVLVTLVVFGIAFFFIRRIRGMSRIKVVMPEFLLNSMQSSGDLSPKAARVAVPGNFSPKAVLNQALEEDVQLYSKTRISRTILDCQNRDLADKEATREESSSLEGNDPLRKIEQEMELSSYVSVSAPTLEHSGANLDTGNTGYSSNVMVNQKIPKDSEKNCVERKLKEQPIPCIAKGSANFPKMDLETGYFKIIQPSPSFSPAINEGKKDHCPYKRVS